MSPSVLRGLLRVGCLVRIEGAGAAALKGLKGPVQVSEFLLRLFIFGDSASSRRAQDQLSRLRDQVLGPGWEIEVVDILAAPEVAEEAGILATPTLSYDHRAGSKRIIGDLGDAARILGFLGIAAKGENI